MFEATTQELHHAYWDEGKTLVDLAQYYGRSPGVIWHRFRKLGIPTRGIKESQALTERAVSSAEVEKMAKLYAEGLSCLDIGEALGRHGALVGTHLREIGVTRSQPDSIRLAVSRGKIRTTTLNERFFETLTPASAWILGLIFGDGHVRVKTGQSYSVYLAGTKAVMQKVAKHLGFNRAPKKSRGANCWILVWNSRVLVEDLKRFGLVGGSKAKTMRWPVGIAAQLLPHFVRGLWDSDGSWSGKGRAPRASYTSASRRFITDLQQVLKTKGWETKIHKKVNYGVKIKGRWHTPATKRLLAYDLWLNVAHSREFSEWVYANSVKKTRCSRKHARAIRWGVHAF